MPQDTLSQGHGATRKADSAKDLQAEYAKSGKQVRKVDDGRMDAASPNAGPESALARPRHVGKPRRAASVLVLRLTHTLKYRAESEREKDEAAMPG